MQGKESSQFISITALFIVTGLALRDRCPDAGATDYPWLSCGHHLQHRVVHRLRLSDEV